MHDPLVRRRGSPSGLTGLLIAALIHCGVWFVLGPRQPNASLHHEHGIQRPSLVMVYIQPALVRPRQVRVDKFSRPEKPLLPSRLPSGRERRLRDVKQDVKPQETHLKTLESASPNVVNVPPADKPAESPSRLNIDELKELARRDMEREGLAQPGHAVRISKPGSLTAHAGQEALERAWRSKCDNNYKPKIGSVEFSGLMKLPFLLKGALPDNGCKW